MKEPSSAGWPSAARPLLLVIIHWLIVQAFPEHHPGEAGLHGSSSTAVWLGGNSLQRSQ